ncbi:hypothetical protein F5Y05DRAFT_225153 [Hypoxylon sp. FL0543]|nr:hypothetical protein F5Y05DRAFT_225153 [Hypoxylon sp. FL0543]
MSPVTFDDALIMGNARDRTARPRLVAAPRKGVQETAAVTVAENFFLFPSSLPSMPIPIFMLHGGEGKRKRQNVGHDSGQGGRGKKRSWKHPDVFFFPSCLLLFFPFCIILISDMSSVRPTTPEGSATGHAALGTISHRRSGIGSCVCANLRFSVRFGAKYPIRTCVPTCLHAYLPTYLR